MSYVLASLFCLCFTAASYCSTTESLNTLKDFIFEAILPATFMSIFLLFSIPNLVISICIYYWFLKPISFLHICTYILVDLASASLGLFLTLIILKIASMYDIIQSSYTGAVAITFLILNIPINMFAMHHTFNYSYKKIALPIIINTVIRVTVALTLLQKPGLGL